MTEPIASLPLAGRTALVTGVSRPKGIGFAVARRLARMGASVVVHHFAPHDALQPWGGADAVLLDLPECGGEAGGAR